MLKTIRHRIRSLSLARKLMVVSGGTSALTVGLLCAAVGWYSSLTLRTRMAENSATLASVIGANSSAAVAFGDERAAASTLRAVAGSRQVEMAAIVLRDGAVLARYDRHPDTENTALRMDRPAVLRGESWQEFRGATLAVAAPVGLAGDVIGVVYVELSLDDLRERVAKLRWVLTMLLVTTILLAVLISWRLQRLISGPLLRLTETARVVIDDRNYSTRAIHEGDDEVGQLVNSFNEMLDHIQQRDAILRTHRQDLERIVDTRTAELKANMERFKMLVESTHAVPWEIDTSTYTFSYVAPQVTRLLGYESDAIAGRMTLWNLVHPDDRERVERQLLGLTTASDGSDLDFDYRVVGTSQRVIEVRSVVSVHEQADTGLVVLRGITIDVTHQKKLELELRQAQKLESVGRLASGVAHEINTPVQFVSDSVHFVRDAMADLAAVLQKYREGAPDAAQAEEAADLPYLLEHMPKALDRALEGLHRVAVIVRSMKEFAHPDQREMGALDLNQAIHSTLIIARNEYKYIADVETDLGDLPPVICHGGDINQVILNIVVNAAHAIRDVVAGTDRKGRITVQTRRDGDSVVIRIGDTGGGIPDAIQHRIFDLFFTTKEVGKGTGQGLAISHSVILEKHGGDLSFETEAGRGTTFIIRLPIDGKQIAASGVAA